MKWPLPSNMSFCYTPYIFADDVDFPLKMICSLQLPSSTHPLMHHPATFQACDKLPSATFDAQQLPPAPVTNATFRPSSADWWFTEPLHPVEEPVPDKEESLLPWACTNCSRRFHEGWYSTDFTPQMAVYRNWKTIAAYYILTLFCTN